MENITREIELAKELKEVRKENRKFKRELQKKNCIINGLSYFIFSAVIFILIYLYANM